MYFKIKKKTRLFCKGFPSINHCECLSLFNSRPGLARKEPEKKGTGHSGPRGPP